MKINIKYLQLAFICLASCSTPKTTEKSFSEISCSQALSSLSTEQETTFLDKPFWLYFEDSQLNQLESMLCRDNKTLLAEEYKIKTIFDNVTALKGGILPQFNYVFQDFFQYYSRQGVYAALTRDHLPAYYNDLTTGIGFNWNLDLAGQQKFQYKALIQQGIANFYKLKGTHLDLSATLAKTFYSLKILANIKLELDKQLSFFQKMLKLTLALFTYDQVNTQHVIEVEKKIKRLEIELDMTKHHIIADQALLKTLIAKMPDDYDLDLDQKLPKILPFLSLDHLKLALIAKRPDIQMAVNLLNEASLKIKSAKAAFYPNIALTSLSGLDSINLSSLFWSSSKAFTFTPILTLPIFSAGVLNANLRKEKHNYESLIHSYDQALLKAAQEVLTFSSKFNSSLDDFKKSTQIQLLETEKKDLITANFKAGLVSEISLIEAQLALSVKKLETFELQKDYIFSFIDLSSSLGGGL
jgi:outer membrane protein TolC